MRWLRKKRIHREYVDPDEVFLDSKNLPEFNTQQFEGVIERSIAKKTVLAVASVFTIIVLIFLIRLGFLQIAKGSAYFAESEENRLHHVTLFSKRGVIYDRNGVELAWNVPGEDDEPFLYRNYYDEPGFAHVLGFVRYPKRDEAGFFWRLDLEGADGVEAVVDDMLQGENGLRLVETNARLEEKSEQLIEPAVDGDNVAITIDAGVQATLHAAIAEMEENFGFEGGAGVIMDIHTGEIIALTSFPEFDGEVLSKGQDTEVINEYFKDSTNPSLNRVTNGLYTPGSIVKPFLALGMLQEKVITPETTIFSNGTLEIPNPWNPDEPTVFRDWRPEGHGTTDVYHAIADSVNKFFYVFSGGFEQYEGIGIAGINTYINAFGIGEPVGIDVGKEVSGVVPNPTWKRQVFEDGDWRVGDTYNTAIGQFGFQVTPVQMVRAVAALASKGVLVDPHILQQTSDQVKKRQISEVDTEHYQVIHDAMRQTVTDGTARVLNVPYVHVAAKTGTAQTDGKRKVNAWSMGFFPYENPRYAFTVLMERGPTEDTVGSSWAVRKLLDWMHENREEYFEIQVN